MGIERTFQKTGEGYTATNKKNRLPIGTGTWKLSSDGNTLEERQRRNGRDGSDGVGDRAIASERLRPRAGFSLYGDREALGTTPQSSSRTAVVGPTRVAPRALHRLDVVT
jgi:hypothetical protein